MKYEKKVVTFMCVKDVDVAFQEKYPRLLTIFLNRAMCLALKDRKFFDDVFHSDVLKDLHLRPNQK